MTEVRGSREKGKQKGERVDGAEEEKEEKETSKQEEENRMEGVEESVGTFSPVAYSVGMGNL